MKAEDAAAGALACLTSRRWRQTSSGAPTPASSCVPSTRTPTPPTVPTPAATPTRAACAGTATGSGPGRCASTPASRSAEETNTRFRLLLDRGQTGLSVAFDLPTQLGLDSDHPLARGEVGRTGVAIDSIEDMRLLMAGIPLGDVSTSMTINAPGSLLLLLYELVAEEQGVAAERLSGTIQNDILKEYIARGNYIFPARPSMRLTVDTFRYCTERLPRWNTISISGYHIREAGSTAAQELAFTIANGIAYVQAAVDAGLDGGRVRAAAVLLLQRAQRLLPGGRQVPRRPHAVGRADARALRSRRRAQPDAALPRPDRRLHADRPAAREQHRAGGDPGLLGGLRRRPEPAHQRIRRGAGAAHRAQRDDRAAHAADPGDRGRLARAPPIRWAAATTSRR